MLLGVVLLLCVTPQKMSEEGVPQKVRGHHEMTRTTRHGSGKVLNLLIAMLLLTSLCIDNS